MLRLQGRMPRFCESSATAKFIVAFCQVFQNTVVTKFVIRNYEMVTLWLSVHCQRYAPCLRAASFGLNNMTKQILYKYFSQKA